MAIVKDFITRYGVLVQGTNAVTSSTGQTGALQVDGGAAVAKNLIVGDNAVIYGAMTIKGPVTFEGPTSGAQEFTITNALDVLSIHVSQTLAVDGQSTLDTLLVNGTSTFNSNIVSNGSLTLTGNNTLTVGTGTTTLGGNLNIDGRVVISNTTHAAPNGISALKVMGGEYIGDNLYIAGTDANTSTDISNSLFVAGGAWVDKTLVVVGDTLLKGNLIISGTSTYVYSTNTVYTDNLLELHVPPGGVNSVWTVDDGKDIGLRFHYYTGSTDTNAALVLANDTKYLEWYSAGAEGSGVFTGTSYGIFKTGGVILVNTSTATSSVTGALQVAGGIGVGANIYADGAVSGSTLYSRNLTQGRIVFAGANGQLTDDGELTYDSITNLLSADASRANTATNISGGGPGQIPYQIDNGQTGFIATGTSGYILQSGGTGAPTWESISNIAAGAATTATNIAGGSSGQLVYQSAPGITGFVGPGNAGQFLQSRGAGLAPQYVNTGNMYVGNAVFADNLKGGNTGFIPYQTAPDSTQFINIGTSGSLLQSDGTTATFVTTSSIMVAAAYNAKEADKWTTARTITLTGDLGGTVSLDGSTNVTLTANITATSINATIIGISTTATNLAGGIAGQIPYQNTAGNTLFTGPGFAGDVLVSRGSNGPLFQNTLTLAGTANSISTQSGAFQVIGGAGIGGNLYVGNKLVVNDTSDSAATNQGAIVTPGGMGIGKSLYVGEDITVGPTAAGSVVPGIYTNNVLLASYTSPTINSASTATIDTYSSIAFRTARYTVQVVDGNNIHISEIVVSHNGINAYINQYGIITNGGELGTFDASLSGSTITLTYTPTAPSNMIIKVVRFSLTA